MSTNKTVKKPNILPQMPKSEMDWRAREDMHTLSRAREIEMDKKRMMAAQREAQNEIKKIQSVIGKKK